MADPGGAAGERREAGLQCEVWQEELKARLWGGSTWGGGFILGSESGARWGECWCCSPGDTTFGDGEGVLEMRALWALHRESRKEVGLWFG